MIIAVNDSTPVSIPSQGNAGTGNEAPATRLSSNFTACRLRFHWFGTQKTLDSNQTTRAAETFGADKDSIGARKKLIDTKSEVYRALTSLKGEMRKYWQRKTLPYPEDGIRLMRNDEIQNFDNQMDSYAAELRAEVQKLENKRVEIINNARERLGELFNESDYPTSFLNEFSVEWDYPSLTPPAHLNPDIYEIEQRKIRARFEEAAALTQQAFQEEFGKMVEHLAESLKPNEEGKRKRFHATNLTNLTEFFERFEELNIGGNEQLEEMINQAKSTLQGVGVEQLKSSDEVRNSISSAMSKISSSIDGMMQDAPERAFG